MKSFFKTFFASFLGSAALVVLLFIILTISLISSIASSTDNKVTAKPQTVLYMKLNYEIPERSNPNKFNFIISGSNFSIDESDNAGMNDIINNIKAAAIDPNISGILLELSSVGTNIANIEELRNQIIEFRKSGKFVISYGESYTQSAYYLATACGEIYMFNDGTLDLRGLASQTIFYKNLLEKLDIEVEIIRPANNKYKSAVEPYFLDKMSDANREQTTELFNSVWETICHDISATRGISIETINNFADDLTLFFDSKAAVDNNFIDGLMYRDELIQKVKEAANISKDSKINIIQNMQYAKSRPSIETGADKIAIIYASGQIFDGKGDENTIGSETLSKAIREARNDKKVKAVVMRVNSPGGSASASEVIRREVELTAKEKPFIVSMGGYAASGGYWISSSSDYIFADPNTLTGSIGVFGTIPNLEDFLNDKIGLTFDGVKTNKNADFGSISKPMTPYQLNMMQKYVTETYDDFITLVSTERNLRKTFVDSIGQGRVWSGSDAIEIGLVDELGGIENAITFAAEKAGLESYSLKEFPKQEDIFESLFKTNVQEYYTKSVLKNNLGSSYKYFKTLETVKNIDGIQALMPFVIVE